MPARTVAIAALAVVAVAATVAAAGVLLDDGEAPDVAATPAPTAAATPPTPDAPDASPTPTLEPLEGPRPEGVDELAEQVSALRALPIAEPLDARTVPRAELGDRFAEVAKAELDPDDVAASERLLIALRLIEPDVDLLAVLESFYSEQVLGMYSTREQILYVGADGPQLSPAQEITAAHEITHALQDQAFGLEGLLDFDDVQSDRSLAALALVEGDAVLVQELWAAQHLSPEEREEARVEALAGGGGDALREAPRYVRDALLFPYREGAWFAQALVEDGGFDAVDAAFERLPTSTAEIMDPDRYLDGWSPEEVSVTGEPAGEWSQGRSYEFGAFDLAQLLAPLGEEAETVAAGWSGGEVRHWSDGEDDAVAVVVLFEDPEAALGACEGAPTWYGEVADGSAAGAQTMQGDRDWMAWTCSDEEVRLGLGPDEATATALVKASGVPAG